MNSFKKFAIAVLSFGLIATTATAMPASAQDETPDESPELSYQESVLSSSPTVYYRLDETDGPTAVDSSGNGNDTPYTASATLNVDGVVALDPAGRAVSGVANLPVIDTLPLNLPSGDANRTVEVWSTMTQDLNQWIIEYGNRFGLYYYGSSETFRIYWGLGGTDYVTINRPDGFTPRDGQYHHYTVTYDGTTLALHIDGTLAGTANKPGINTQLTTGLKVGRQTGNYDEIAIYPTVLTNQQIAQHHAIGRTGSACPAPPIDAYGTTVLNDGPVVYSRLNQVESLVAFDYSVNCAPGSYLTGATSETTGAILGSGDDAVNQSVNNIAARVGDTSALPSGATPRTVEVWSTMSTDLNQWIIEYGNRFGLYYYGSDETFRIYWGLGGTDFTTINRPDGFTPRDGQYHHYTVVYNNPDISLYIDGFLAGKVALGEIDTVLDRGLMIGRQTGSYDEAAVYATALTPEQINRHYSIARSITGTECPADTTDGYGLAILANQPTVFLRPDTNPDIAYDHSGNCINGALATQTSPAPGINTANGAITSPLNTVGILHPGTNLPSGDANRTVEVWSTMTQDLNQWIIEYGNRFGLYYYGSSETFRIYWGLGGTDYVTINRPDGFTPRDGQYHHYTVTYDGTTLALHIDGTLAGTANKPGINTQLTTGLKVGRQTGNYDEIAIYPTVLTNQQIAQHHAIGRTGSACPAPPIDAYGTTVLNDGPVVYSRLNQVESLVAFDYSVNCAPGSYLTGATSETTGAILGSGDDAVNQSVNNIAARVGDTSALPSGATPRTVEVWSTMSTDLNQWIIEYGNRFGLYYYGSDETFRIYWGLGGTDFTTINRPDGFTPRDGQYHHYTVVYNNPDISLYIDGFLAGKVALGEIDTVLDRGLMIGRQTGSYDEAAVYATALTPEQINRHYSIARSITGTECPADTTDGYGLAILANQPTVFLRPDTNPDIAYDHSGNCINGALATQTSPAPGINTANGAITSPLNTVGILHPGTNLPSGDANRTVEVWSTMTQDLNQWIIEYGNRFGLYYYGSSETFRIYWGLGGTDYVTINRPDGFTPRDGQYHHYTVTYDGTTLALHIDGTLAGTANKPGINTQLTTGLKVGRQTGNYDEIAIYPTVLTNQQIAQHHAIGRLQTTTITLEGPPTPWETGTALTFAAQLMTADAEGNAVVASEATGQVRFVDDNTELAVVDVVDGRAELSVELLNGNHAITAEYLGDETYSGALSIPLESNVVVAGLTTTSITLSSNDLTFGETATAVVTVVGPNGGGVVPTGGVTVFVDGVAISDGTLESGAASIQLDVLGVGLYPVTATYNGDVNFDVSSSDAELLTVSKVTPVVAGTVPDTAVFGEPVEISVAVTAGLDGEPVQDGEVQVRAGPDEIVGQSALNDGTATVVLNQLPVGEFTLTIEYLGGLDAVPATSPTYPITISGASTRTTVTAADGDLISGETATVVVAVSALSPATGVPAGDVTLLVDGVEFSSSSLTPDGSTEFSIPDLALGQHTLEASFTGSDSWLPSASPGITVVVRSQAELTVLPQQQVPVVGQTTDISASIEVFAAINADPTGTVQFTRDDGITLGSAVLNTAGVATISTTLPVGDSSVSARYLGDENLAPVSSAAIVFQVNKAESDISITSDRSPAAVDGPLSLTATVVPAAPGAGTPSGLVTFFADGSELGTATATEGIAVLQTSLSTSGSVSITATYAGDENFEASTSDAFLQQIAAATAIDLTVEPQQLASNLQPTLTATVTELQSGNPAQGTVTFLVDGVEVGQAATGPSGRATLTIDPLDSGQHVLETRFSGSNIGPSTAELTVEVATAMTIVGLSLDTATAQFGGAVIATVQLETVVGAKLNGLVSISDQAGTIATGFAEDGVATITLPTLTPGLYELRANFGGTANLDPGSSDVAQLTISSADTAVSLSTPDVPAAPASDIDLTIEVSALAPGGGTPEGIVRITTNPGTSTDLELSNGRVTTTVTTPDDPGEFIVTAEYLGSDSHAVSTGDPLTLQINTAGTIAVTPPLAPTGLGDAATFAVVVSGTNPTGTVDLLEGDRLLARQPLLDGAAELSTGALSAGDRELTVLYSGDENNAASTTQLTHTVLSAATSLDLSSSKTTVGQDQTVRLTAIVIPDAQRGPDRGGFVTFLADGLAIANAQVDARGYATVSYSFSDIGSYEITANYGGNSDYEPSTAPGLELDVVAPVVANLTLPEIQGAAPFTVRPDASASEGAPTTFSFDFGNGQTLVNTGASAVYTYEQPGIYNITVTASNDGVVDYTTTRVIVTEDAPLAAIAGEDVNVEAGYTVTFDGRASTPDFGIETYLWDFGDGSTATGPIATHAYSDGGSYTASLTVFQNGESLSDSIQVDVFEPIPGTGLAVNVKNQNGEFISGAQVLVTDTGEGRFEAVTNNLGIAELYGLAEANYDIYAIADGFQPNRVDLELIDGTGEVTIVLTEGEVGLAEVVTRRLTIDEIVEAGIDINDPANLEIVEFETVLTFGTEFPEISVPVSPRVNSTGQFVASSGCTIDICRYDIGSGATSARVEARPVILPNGDQAIWWLVLPGRASWLKEFFEVKLIVTNLASSDFAFTSGAAQLHLPAGLTLAPTRQPQSLVQDMADIPGGAVAEAKWILRGDVAGEYDISATFTGQLFPFGTSIRFDATADDPLKVYGSDALQGSIVADELAVQGSPYNIDISLTNVSPIPVYGVNLGFKSDSQIGATEFEAPKTFIYQPDQRLLYSDAVLEPGETLTAKIVVLPTQSGSLNLEESFVTIISSTTNLSFDITDRVVSATPPVLTASAGRMAQVDLSWPDDGREYNIYARPVGLGVNAEAGLSSDQIRDYPVAASFTLISDAPASGGNYTVNAAPGSEAVYAIRAAGTGLLPPTVHPPVTGSAGAEGGTTVDLSSECFVENDREWVLTLDVSNKFGDPVDIVELYQVVPTDPNLPPGAPDTKLELIENLVQINAGRYEYKVPKEDFRNGDFITNVQIPIGVDADGNPVTSTMIEDDGTIVWSGIPEGTLRLRSLTFLAKAANSADHVFISGDTAGPVGDEPAEPPTIVYGSHLSDKSDAEIAELTAGLEKITLFGDDVEQIIDPCDYEATLEAASNALNDAYIAEQEAQGRGCEFQYADGFGWDWIKKTAKNTLCVGDPVVPATGNLVTAQTDASYPGTGIPFSFTRTYNSTDNRVGPLGRGWTFDYDMAIEVPAVEGTPFVVRSVDGARYSAFPDGTEPSGASRYTVPGSAMSIVQLPVGDYAYRMTMPNGAIQEFNTLGNLVRTRDVNDQGLYLEWVEGELRSITDEAGRIVQFTYTDGLITTMTLNDGRTVTYAYEAGTLRFVTDPRGNVYEYRYDADGNLVEEIDQRGERVHLTEYDPATGRAIKQTNAYGGISTFEWDPETSTSVYTDPSGTQTTTVHDGLAPISSTNSQGNTAIVSYNAVGLKDSGTDYLGRTVRMEYDDEGNMITRLTPGITPGTERAEIFTYNSNGQRLTSTNQDGLSTQYTYDTIGRMTSVESALDRRIEYQYNSRGQVRTSSFEVPGPSGQLITRATTFDFDDDFNISSECDALNRCTQFQYDTEGRVIGAVGPTGDTASFTYDAMNNRLSETDPLGRTTTYQYNELNQVIRATNAAGEVFRFEYNVDGELAREWMEGMNPTVYAYDSEGRIISITNSAGETVSMTYDILDRVVSQTDSLGRTTTFGYDIVGNRTSVTDPTGATTTTVYDSLNRPSQVTNANGEKTVLNYDGTGDLVAVTDNIGNTTQMAYDALGRPVEVTDARGARTTTTYNSAGEVLRSTDAEGGISTFQYNAAGELTAVVEPRGNVPGTNSVDFRTSFLYDVAGNLEQTIDAQGGVSSFTYDAIGKMLSSTDAEGRTTSYTYDDVDRVTAVTAPDGAVTRYTYDNVGDLIRRTDPRGNDTVYTYDDAHRLVSTTDPVGNTYSMTYDAVGNPKVVTDPQGRTTTFTYDLRNQVTLIDYSDPATPDVAYDYDTLGRVIAMTDGDGTETYSYDGIGRTTGVARNGQSFEYGYDPVGNIISRLYPDSTVIDYTYDLRQMAETISVGGATSSYSYDAAGLIETATAANGVTTDFDFDTLSRLTQWTSASNTDAVAFQARSFDRVGNPLSDANSFGVTEYLYDDRDRLTSEDSETVGASSLYGYDENGNRLTKSNDVGLPEAMTYDAADQLISRTIGTETTEYSYDANGNLLSDGDWAYTYDQLNRLVAADEIVAPNPPQVDYREAVIADGAVGYWTFDDLDQDGNFEPRAGTQSITGAADGLAPYSQLDGALSSGDDGSLRFETNEGDVRTGSAESLAPLAGDYALDFWIQVPEVPVRNRSIVRLENAEGDAWRVELRTGGELRLRSGRNRFDSEESIVPGQWNHVAVTVDGLNATWILNGTVANTEVLREQDPRVFAEGDHLRFAKKLNIELDEFALYPTAVPVDRLSDRAAAANYPEAVLEDGPAVYFRMGEDQRSEALIDSSGNGLDGILRLGGTRLIDGAVADSNGIEFVEETESLRIRRTDAGRLAGDYTIEFWAQTSSPTAQGTDLLRYGNALRSGWAIRRLGDVLEFQRGGEVHTSPVLPDSDAWTHFAVTVEAGVVTWWVNGTAFVSETPAAGFKPARNLKRLTFGDLATPRAALDEVALYETALTADQIVTRLPQSIDGENEDPQTISYTYDGNNLRRTKTVNGVTTRFEWDQLHGVAQVALESTPGELRRWVYDGAGPLQVRVGTEEWFTHQDVTGSTVAVTNSAGQLATEFDYDAFGNIALELNTLNTPEGLERYGDGTPEETGLWFLRARYYNSETGTFIARDAIDTAVGDSYVSRYSYVGSRPTVLVDPSGYKAWNAGAAAISGIADGIGYAIQNPGAVFDSIKAELEDGISLHTFLDIAGMIPVVGIVFDLANAAIYAFEGDWTNAGLSMLGAIPLVGQGLGAAKVAFKSADALGTATRGLKRGTNALGSIPSSVRSNFDAATGFGANQFKAVNEGIQAFGTRIKTAFSKCNSFTPGTMVLMADGSSVAIENLQVGDIVLAANPSTGEVIPRPVTHTITGTGVKTLVQIVTDTGVITATDEHPFWVENRSEWVDAVDLEAGDLLVTEDGDTVTIEFTETSVEWDTVHNVTIDALHTYYVSDGAEWVLNHNAKVCPLTGVSETPVSITITKAPGNLGDIPSGKTVAVAGDSKTLSGWGDAPPGFDRASPAEVLQLQADMGFPVRRAGAFDQGTPGQYFASHAERQLAVLQPGKAISVSSPMCADCQAFFSRLADHTGSSQRVTDPNTAHLFGN